MVEGVAKTPKRSAKTSKIDQVGPKNNGGPDFLSLRAERSPVRVPANRVMVTKNSSGKVLVFEGRSILKRGGIQ